MALKMRLYEVYPGVVNNGFPHVHSSPTCPVLSLYSTKDEQANFCVFRLHCCTHIQQLGGVSVHATMKVEKEKN